MTSVEFLQQLFDRLWDAYRSRVTYVRDYEQVVASAGATFLNDHIAFRSIAWQQPTAGLSSISRPFEALGYRPAACYHIPGKHLQALHLAPPVDASPASPTASTITALPWRSTCSVGSPASTRPSTTRRFSRHSPPGSSHAPGRLPGDPMSSPYPRSPSTPPGFSCTVMR